MTHTHEQLNDYRQRVLRGEDVSVEEYAALLASLRAKRTGDITAVAEKKATATKAKKAPAAPVELPDLLADL